MSVIGRNYLPGQRRRVRTTAMTMVLCLLAALLTPLTADALEQSELDGATVYLINLQTGRFLDADANNGTVGQSRTPAIDDRWIMTETSPGTFSFENAGMGRLLDADGPFTGYDVNLSNGLDTDTEWTLTPVSDGVYQVSNVEYGQYLTADGVLAGANVALSESSDANAQWYIGLANPSAGDLDGATVLMANDATGLFLDVDRNTKSVNQSIAPRIDDHWIVEQIGDNVTFRNAGVDRLLHGTADEVDIEGAGGLDTQWQLRQRNNGTYEVRNADVGLWLDADNANQDFNVDLSVQVNDDEANWHLIVIDTDQGCVTEALDSIDDLLGCVDASDMFVHLQAFQDFADASDGTRASGTLGYDLSADYVAEVVEAAGFTVERQVFDFSQFTPISDSLIIDDIPSVLIDDYLPMTFSASGEIIDANIVAVDLDLGLDNTSTSGCEPEDFDGLDFSGDNDIALIQRGACAFATKGLNAQAAGAEGAIVFNQGNTEDRKDVVFGTLGSGVVGTIAIPVFGTGYDLGVGLLEATSVSMALEAETVTSTTENVIADLAGVNPDNVVMAGAHLDSVEAGPGIQDNGSGSAALLTLAEVLGYNETYVPQNTLRFAWWGAEESGLIGSNEYVFNPEFGLTDEEYFALALYLNFDMIASPNYVHGVYDADESTFTASAPVPDGSAALEDLFESYYTLEGIPYEDSEFSGRSDYEAFISVGIPASGLFTGAEVVKTDEQQAIWGGTAGEQFDQCYHLACDTIDNVSYEALETNGDAVAYAVYIMAASTEVVNGVAGVNVNGITPDEVEFDGPRGTFGGEGGGAAVHYGHEHDADRR